MLTGSPIEPQYMWTIAYSYIRVHVYLLRLLLASLLVWGGYASPTRTQQIIAHTWELLITGGPSMPKLHCPDDKARIKGNNFSQKPAYIRKLICFPTGGQYKRLGLKLATRGPKPFNSETRKAETTKIARNNTLI